MGINAHDRLHEKCAVVGVSTLETGSDAARIAYQALFALQHRGVEASGIITNGDGDANLRKVRAPGMVRDVFGDTEIEKLRGSLAVGHNRYSTSGDKTAHLQPVVSDEINFAFSHNGNIPDTSKLEAYLTRRRYVTAKYNDSELFGHAISSKLHAGRSIVEAVSETQKLVRGAYSCVAMYDDQLVAFRDPNGIRPLEIGSIDGCIVFASETCALDTVGARHVRSVEPGELVIASGGKIVATHQLAAPDPKLDIFEYVYFARHDSYLYGHRVNEVRRRFGEQLAKRHALELDNAVVMHVPDTSAPAAEGYASALGLPHEAAIIKNRYVGRTFLQPNQASRRRSLQLKHTMISERISGRDIILIDDSIVRGNTLPRLVALAKKQGARSVTVLVASAPVRFPDFYGVDTPSQNELMAANMSIEDMRVKIGCDYLGFLSVSDMVRATGSPKKSFNLASFNGDYPVKIGEHMDSIRPPVNKEYME